MKIYNGTQHADTGDANESWLALRAGKFTGSDFHQYMGIIKKGMLSDSAESNLYQKVLESLGQTFDSYTSDAMARGTELEAFARKEYIGETFNDVQEVQFVDWEQLRAGCSPDGVIYDNNEAIKKIIEIKCPNLRNYMKMVNGIIPPVYMTQMQFNMLITGAKSCDFVVYHPDMRLSIQEIKADADYQKDIVTALKMLNDYYDLILKQIERFKR
ncbi:MAG: YqaJ viral recombinase family protein [Alphaproteobacteria bacterium]|nr:YqaJ viral recombinase family protein [Alphaproteobacteria bacterium]